MKQFRQGFGMFWWGLGLVFLMVAPPVLSEELSNEPQALEGEALFTQLVTTAIEYDTYNNRCRGVSASQNESNVNRLFLRKYDITLNNYLKTYVQSDVRQYKARLKTQIYTKVVELGGCTQADQTGYEKSLKKRFRKLYRDVDQSPWYPQVTNR